MSSQTNFTLVNQNLRNNADQRQVYQKAKIMQYHLQMSMIQENLSQMNQNQGFGQSLNHTNQTIFSSQTSQTNDHMNHMQAHGSTSQGMQMNTQ